MVRALRLTFALAISSTLFASAATTPRSSAARAAAERVKLLPNFKPGDVYRYQVDLRTSTVSQSTGPIADPQGSSKLDRVVTATVRLEVLKVESEANNAGERIRLRTTYEQSSAKSKSDSYDPQEDEIEKQYKNLEGHSLEFTLEADGTVTEIEGPRRKQRIRRGSTAVDR